MKANEDLASENQARWNPILEKLKTNLQYAIGEGSDASVRRHQQRGQLLARDRISLLLDDGSPFLELCYFAGIGTGVSSPCASLVAGIGSVCGRPVLLMSHIPTCSGGAWNEYTVLKKQRIMQIGKENNLPLISLVQSAGVFLPQQFKVFHKVGRLFRDLSLRSDRGQPSCAVVFGSSTAGGAYQPALSDYTIFVKDQAQVFLGGPPLVKMAISEEIDAESLGGSEVHGTITGLADHVAENEFEAILKAREWVAQLPDRSAPKLQPLSPLEPRSSAEDLLSLVDPDIRRMLPMDSVLYRITDDSHLSAFKPEYGINLITAWARICGHKVGIVANQIPVVHVEESNKGAQFIRLCNQQEVPILFFHNITGFMVGSRAEHSGIIKRGAQMVSAVSCSKVPHISVIVGASYGAGNYAMCGRAYKPRFLFSWPSGRCSVMGPDQLSGVMEIVMGGKNGKDGAKAKEKLRAEVERDSECYSTSAQLLDDGVIDPRDTREVLGMCLEVVNAAGYSGAESHRGLARM